jgi:hypothetical protein
LTAKKILFGEENRVSIEKNSGKEENFSSSKNKGVKKNR